MTMPHTCPPGSPLTRSFSASTAVEAEDSVPPLPNYSPNDPSQRSSPAAKTGSKSILRSSSSLDNESTTAPRTKRVKKHVSITLPGSSRPMIASRRRLRENAGSATADGTLRNASDDEPTTAEPDEVIVQVDVHEMTVGKCTPMLWLNWYILYQSQRMKKKRKKKLNQEMKKTKKRKKKECI